MRKEEILAKLAAGELSVDEASRLFGELAMRKEDILARRAAGELSVDEADRLLHDCAGTKADARRRPAAEPTQPGLNRLSDSADAVVEMYGSFSADNAEGREQLAAMTAQVASFDAPGAYCHRCNGILCRQVSRG